VCFKYVFFVAGWTREVRQSGGLLLICSKSTG